MSVLSDIQAEAVRLGFSFASLVPLSTPPHYQSFLDWIEQGNHGTMHYLSSSRSLLVRKEPTELLPDARSLISLGMRYPSPLEKSGYLNQAQIASFAWTEDYHH